MTLTNASETALLALLFENAAWTGIGDAGGLLPSATDGFYWISLHTSDPGEAPTNEQSENEANYGGYLRVSLTRDTASTGWTVSGNSVTNNAAVEFAEATSGSNTITHFGIGAVNTAGGNGTLFMVGVLTSPISVTTGIQPVFAIGQLSASAD